MALSSDSRVLYSYRFMTLPGALVLHGRFDSVRHSLSGWRPTAVTKGAYMRFWNTYDGNGSKPSEINTSYCASSDMTFITETTFDWSGDPVSVEVVGFYFGEPDADSTLKYKGSLKARLS